jgi:tRNA 2-selenouridine synthase
MSITSKISIDTYIQQFIGCTLIDVRSEDEYIQGHIPDAINYPLLKNEERKQVGICYKQKGKQAAIELGYQLVGLHFATYIKDILKLTQNKPIVFYCFRGGLRSTIMSQLLSNAGKVPIYQIKGGYKTYRHWAKKTMETTKHIYILGGFTGSQKTERIHTFAELGMQTIDLEGLANHRGSALGHINKTKQPSVESFENVLAWQWAKINPLKPLWLEDESRSIGKVQIPESIYKQMRNAITFRVNVPIKSRINHIINIYGKGDKKDLIEATKSIQKRLGGKRCNEAIEHLEKNDIKAWVEILLEYYDDGYKFGQNKRNILSVLEMEVETFENYIQHTFPHTLTKVLISLGGNIGQVSETFESAKEKIAATIGSINNQSAIYKTAAWGNTNQPDFLNQVIEIYTSLPAHQLMKQLLHIEESLGRTRSVKYDPRTLDLDILLYGNQTIQSDELTIPHPKIQERKFILIPLQALIPSAIHPKLNQSFTQLLKDCTDDLAVEKI